MPRKRGCTCLLCRALSFKVEVSGKRYSARNRITCLSGCLLDETGQYGVDVRARILVTNRVNILAAHQCQSSFSLIVQSVGKRCMRRVKKAGCERIDVLWEGRHRASLLDLKSHPLL